MQTNSYSNNTNNDNTSPLCEANFSAIQINPLHQHSSTLGSHSGLWSDRQCTRLSWLRSLPECPRSSSRAPFCPWASSYIQSTASSTDWTSVDWSEPGRGILASRTASDAAAPHLALCLRRHVPSLRPPLLLLLLWALRLHERLHDRQEEEAPLVPLAINHCNKTLKASTGTETT